MSSQHFGRQFDRPDSHNILSPQATLLDRLQQPSIIIPAVILLLTLFYQSIHWSPFSRTRQPGEIVWNFVIAITPAAVLYRLESWLNPPLFPVPKSMRPPQPRDYAAKSELLSKILRVDKPGGIMNSVASVGRKGLATLSSSTFVSRNTDQPAGLGNYDNSCFQNSILQGLTSLEPLPNYLASVLDETGNAEKAGNNGSASTLQRLIADLKDRQNNGKTLWTPPRLKSLDTWQQQDAQEYFSKLLDEIDEEVVSAAKVLYKSPGLEFAAARDDTEDSQHSDDSGYQSLTVFSKISSEVKLLRNPLEGLAAQRVACVQCGYSDGLSMIPFNCLTLNLGVGNMEHDLYERLDSYTHLEAIEGVECAKCTLLKVQRLLNIIVGRGKDVGSSEESLREPRARLEAVHLALEEDDFEEKTLSDKCKITAQHRVNSTKTKQAVIARPPQSLAVHMNRSVFDERTGYMFKNLAAVRFPRTLDLGPWCLGSAGGSGLQSEDVVEEEQWLSDPKTSMIAGDAKPSKITGPIYELCAVITHQGQHENGHYICYRRHPRQSSKSDDISSAKSTTSTDGTETKTVDDERTVLDVADSDTSDSEGDRWWRLSDETVWEVSEETVLAQGGVFMLFYDCVDPDSFLTSSTKLNENSETETNTLGETESVEASALSREGGNALDSNEIFHDLASDKQALHKAGETAPPNEPSGLVPEAVVTAKANTSTKITPQANVESGNTVVEQDQVFHEEKTQDDLKNVNTQGGEESQDIEKREIASAEVAGDSLEEATLCPLPESGDEDLGA